MIEIRFRKSFLQNALGVVAALLVAYCAARQGIDYREVIIVAAALSAAVIVLGREQHFKRGFGAEQRNFFAYRQLGALGKAFRVKRHFQESVLRACSL